MLAVLDTYLGNYWGLLVQETSSVHAAFNGNAAGAFETVIVYGYAMSLLWTLTSLIYWMRTHRRQPPQTGSTPRAYTVLIPFHGEPLAALRSAMSMAGVTPPPAEIILIDDGSPVGLPLDTVLPERTRVLQLNQRRGKAGALNAALRAVTTEIVVCIDADTEVRSTDWHPMLALFDDAKLGAVTGRIWPIAQSGLIGKFQQLDYLAVISVIKAAETIWGGLLTVSGAFVAYRHSAVLACGGWREDKAAEDIDMSWRMQCAGWRLAFDNTWTCAVEMAPTVAALWRQRRRWSSGLGQALHDYGWRAVVRGARHLHVVVIAIANLVWIASMLSLAALSIYQLAGGPEAGGAGWSNLGMIRIIEIGLVLFSLQFISAMLIDGRSWQVYIALVPVLPLYGLYFWTILISSFLVGFPTGLLCKRLGIWQPTVRQRALVKEGPVS